jgi:hypothetical protein
MEARAVTAELQYAVALAAGAEVEEQDWRTEFLHRLDHWLASDADPAGDRGPEDAQLRRALGLKM